MELWLGVKNFAKIESAKIRVDGFTLLVGPNNSGKTFLMQLAHGITAKLYALLNNENAINLLFDSAHHYCLSSENVSVLADYINEKLYLEKEEIVREIFQKEIEIEELSIDMKLAEWEAYEITLYKDMMLAPARSDMKEFYEFFINMKKELKEELAFSVLIKKDMRDGSEQFISSIIGRTPYANYELVRATLRVLFAPASLYLPASRTGLLLLYREFFANQTDNAIAYKVEKDKAISNQETYGGLTKPVYEFLRFLQTHKENGAANRTYQEELDFFDRHLIEGHINISQQGSFSYQPINQSQTVPMFLASSMVNEIAPIALAISGYESYERLIIDEAEASLHPFKQQELVRFLSRLNKKDMKLIVSTHSDTFVSKLNNLFVLSNQIDQRNKAEAFSKLNLEERDLIDKEQLFVYEFVTLNNGKYAVEEIIGDAECGYQFDLFTNSAMKLYDEAAQLGELRANDETAIE